MEAFNRDGKKPLCIKVNDEQERVQSIIDKARDLQEKGHKSIAIICKTNEECMKAMELMRG